MLIAGCRSLGKSGEMKIRQEILILPFVAISFALPYVADDFDLVLNLHSLILSEFMIVALVELWRTRIGTFGWKVMLLALGLLSADLLQSFILFAFRRIVVIPAQLMAYDLIADLVLQMMLGFGMVIVLLELVLADARIANQKLKKAHEKLEELAHIDPLTTAFNRHAFHRYINRKEAGQGPAPGSVGFFDVDDLKSINDIYGHAVGDIAIRAVVRAIRDLVRAEDLIFRWGGEEFFFLIVGLDATSATARMEPLENMLTYIRIDGAVQPLSIRVSHAFADFADVSDLDATIAEADAGMYRQKQLRKVSRDVVLSGQAVDVSLQAPTASAS